VCQPGLKHDLRTILVLLLLPLLLPITTTATASDIYTLLSSFSSTGSIPFGVAVDRNGNVFVCNSYSNNVAKFDNSGNLLTVFGSYGSGPSQLYYNTGIAVDGSGYVFVTSYLGDRIEKFDNNGNFVTEWTPGFEPTGIAVDSNGNVFVAEESGFVEKFDNNGNFITRWSGYSYGIAVDPNGNVFVSAAGSLITKYDNNGNYISSFYANGSAYFNPSCYPTPGGLVARGIIA
jgi:DNA-binding beta-propeller fold protein YncE